MRAYDESHVLPNSRQLLRQKMTKLVPPTVLILLIRPIIFKVYTSLIPVYRSFLLVNLTKNIQLVFIQVL